MYLDARTVPISNLLTTSSILLRKISGGSSSARGLGTSEEDLLVVGLGVSVSLDDPERTVVETIGEGSGVDGEDANTPIDSR